MTELPFEFWNKLASQLITISSLLSGFSIAITANLIVNDSNSRLENNILKVTTIASGCFLITVFAMTRLSMLTSDEFPKSIEYADLVFSKNIGIMAFVFGITSLAVIISLSGWTKSRKTGIFTTSVGVITFLIILMTLIEIRF